MKNLKNLSTISLSKIPNSLAIVILVVALLGFADASYLTIEHFQGVIPPCTTSGCETVLTSSYSAIFGIPVSLLGALYYFLIAVGMVTYLDSKNTKLLKWVLFATVLGLLCSVWFVILQLFIVKAICQYCMISAGTSALLFILACFTMKKYSKGREGSLLHD